VAWIPVPVRVIVAGELVALLSTETVPVKLLALVGEKAIDNGTACPAVSVEGGALPVVLKPPPDTVIWAMFTLELPVLVSVAVCIPGVPPTATFPKFRLVGVTDSWSVAAVPVPLKEITAGEFVASLASETLPEALPACWGANLTVNVAVWPADSVTGVVMPLIVKPEPEIEAWDRVNAAVPELVNVTDWVVELPTATLPKLTVLTLTESWECPLDEPEPDEDTDDALPQPVSGMRSPVQAIANRRPAGKQRKLNQRSQAFPGYRRSKILMFVF
jgi:hypothetical protein